MVKRLLVLALACSMVLATASCSALQGVGLGKPDPRLVQTQQDVHALVQRDLEAHPELAPVDKAIVDNVDALVGSKSDPYQNVVDTVAPLIPAPWGQLLLLATAAFTAGKTVYRTWKGQPSAGKLASTTVAVDQHAKLIDSVTPESADSAATVATPPKTGA